MPIGLGIGLCLTQSPICTPLLTPPGTYTTEDGTQNYTDESGNPYTTEST